MKHILVSTDGSESADRAVDYAARMAADYDANLLIVNVMGHGLPDNLFSRISGAQQSWLEELLETESAETLSKARTRVQHLGARMVRLESRRGDAAQTIIEIAQEQKCDLIVAGKRGAGRVGGLLLGSVSQKLVSLAPLPVTIVP